MADQPAATTTRHDQIEHLLRNRFAAGDADAERILNLLARRPNVVLFGPPGTGKTRTAFAVAEAWRARFGDSSVFHVTFHPSYSYEDFVQGYRPVDDDPGSFALKDGILLEAARVADDLRHLDAAVLLVIDEINRGDVARIFGELITYVEPDKRDKEFNLSQEPTHRRSIPRNLHFLGTMNTADKSVSLLDVAMRRRFAFVEFASNPGAFTASDDWAEQVGGVPLGAVLEGLNERLRREGIERERSIGHALLGVPRGAPDPMATLRERFLFDVLPLVGEYCYGDADRARRVLGPYVDQSGNPAEITGEEFIALLEAIAGDAPNWDAAAVVQEAEPTAVAGPPQELPPALAQDDAGEG